jgi:hypothetical protein
MRFDTASAQAVSKRKVTGDGGNIYPIIALIIQISGDGI